MGLVPSPRHVPMWSSHFRHLTTEMTRRLAVAKLYMAHLNHASFLSSSLVDNAGGQAYFPTRAGSPIPEEHHRSISPAIDDPVSRNQAMAAATKR